MSYRYAAAAGIAALSLAFAGCELAEGSLVNEDGLESPEDDLFEDEAEDPQDDQEPVRGGIIAPDRVEVFVGDELLLDVRMEDPSEGTLQPAQVPEGSEFERLEDGGILHWRPEADDIGTHDIVFVMFDLDGIMLMPRTIIIDVLPRFDLIEYGF